MKFDKEKCKKKPFDVPVSGFQQLKKTDLEQKKNISIRIRNNAGRSHIVYCMGLKYNKK